MANVYQITEYGSFVSDRDVPGCKSLPAKTFEQLKDFILSNRSKDTDALELMQLSARRGVGEILTAQNFVGMIAMKDGTVIEILPKIWSHEEENQYRTKKLLIDMLRTLRIAPFRNLQTAGMDVARLDVFDIFIRMFINEVFWVVKRGLKNDYKTIQQNETFFKGRLLIAQNIRQNIAHKERSFIEFDDYNANRPENRLIKTTLVYLLMKTHSSKNKSDLKMLISRFDQVDVSDSIEDDFCKCVPDRNMKDYEMALVWCRVFLQGKSFTSYTGSQVTVALLFPMETLFESYIAAKLTKALVGSDYRVSVQDRMYHLFDEPRRFSMRPDIVVRSRKDNSCFILDTKWKVLAEDKFNYGISQSDMYQMYAYQKKYDANHVRLVYPMTKKLTPEEPISYKALDGAQVHVEFVDLYDINNSIEVLVNRIIFAEKDSLVHDQMETVG